MDCAERRTIFSRRNSRYGIVVFAAQVMCGVEKEAPKRPARSTMINPPVPPVLRDSNFTAASAAACAS